MKILYDGKIFSDQATGGVNRYFAGIIEHLPLDLQPVLLSLQVRRDNWPSHPNLKLIQGPNFEPQRISRRLAREYFRAATAWQRPDIVHPTYYQSLMVRALDTYKCPSVITVYDWIHDIFAEQLDPAREHFLSQRAAVEAADAIICISQSTRRDLLERFPHLESRTSVTPLAGDLDISMSHGPQRVPERPYFLFVGSRAAYKNFDGLLRAFASLARARRDLALAVVGAPFSDAENQQLEALKIAAQVENWDRVEDAHLAKLYRCSLALIYPSFYEGFGIPPLEAMNCQTVVIAANNSSIPEVTGDAALLFDAHDNDALRDRMEAVAEGAINREALIEKGKRRAETFSWQRTSQQTAEIYRSLAGR